MTWLDWAVLAMLVYFVVQGLIKGVLVALLGVAAIVIAYLIAAVALPAVGDFVVNVLRNPTDEWAQWGRLIGFMITFLVVYVLLGVLISVLPGAKRPSTQAQVLGAAAGILKALVAAMAAMGVLLASPLSAAIGQDVERSLLAGHVAAMQARYVQDLRRASPVEFPPVGPDHKF